MSRPIRLVERYRPKRIEDIVGHHRIKAILSQFVKAPYPTSFLCFGPSGVGKTSTPQAVANEIGAKIWFFGSRQANHAAIERFCEERTIDASYAGNPWAWEYEGVSSRLQVAVIDEVDQVPETVSYLLLNKTDGTQAVPNLIWFFTSNTKKDLETRFVSRCQQLDFSIYGMSAEIVKFLSWVWHQESGVGDEPDWERVIADRRSNIRDCLQFIEEELAVRC